jgi:hypothetical protein
MNTSSQSLTPELLRKMDAYWRGANYLSLGQIYLYDNPLLKRPLTLADVKHMLLGHWGTTPGQNFIYVHLNRVIKKYDLDMIYVSGPGHGGPALVATRISRARTRPPARRGGLEHQGKQAGNDRRRDGELQHLQHELRNREPSAKPFAEGARAAPLTLAVGYRPSSRFSLYCFSKSRIASSTRSFVH